MIQSSLSTGRGSGAGAGVLSEPAFGSAAVTATAGRAASLGACRCPRVGPLRLRHSVRSPRRCRARQLGRALQRRSLPTSQTSPLGGIPRANSTGRAGAQRCPCPPATASVPPWCSARCTPDNRRDTACVRYLESIQMLNNIRKVCILPDMPMVGLTHKRAVSSRKAQCAVSRRPLPGAERLAGRSIGRWCGTLHRRGCRHDGSDAGQPEFCRCYRCPLCGHRRSGPAQR